MKSSRQLREEKTLTMMFALYCRDQHGGINSLCTDCDEVITYAVQRLEKCPHGENKPICGKCKIHCYKPEMREKIRRMMRYAGPRMLWHHPGLAMMHMIDGLRKK
ncbi:MAG: nitrous oxide-stimulated promoter family protein [Anaerolineaceae bacterium]|nr:nitrous oxide-stimulated promoter family protein [Anaerolineaceae bacterium]